MALQSYRELEVWQRAMDLAITCYAIAARLPAEERFGLATQIRRAAVSIPANIAEGYGRAGRGEYAYHLSVANGSLKELETHLEVVRRLGFASGEALDPADVLCDRVGRMLGRLRAVVTTRRGSATPDTRPPTPG